MCLRWKKKSCDYLGNVFAHYGSIFMKSEIWIISHCWRLGHTAMQCNVWLAMFLSPPTTSGGDIGMVSFRSSVGPSLRGFKPLPGKVITQSISIFMYAFVRWMFRTVSLLTLAQLWTSSVHRMVENGSKWWFATIIWIRGVHLLGECCEEIRFWATLAQFWPSSVQYWLKVG